MKQYVIDELRPLDYERIKAYCDQHLDADALGGIYRIPLPTELMNETQQAHTACHPLFFTLELLTTHLSCELLIRTHRRVRCDCMGYATEAQCAWLLAKVDAILAQLSIQV